jgi:uncharacterized protein YegL
MTSESQTLDRFQILPFYIICDTSTSMKGAPISAVNNELPNIHRTIAMDPTVNDKCKLSIIGFNTKPKVELPLKRLADVGKMPTLVAGGRTNYGALFKELRNIIEADVQAEKDAGNAVLRPVVYFISDGGATDSWIKIFEAYSDRGANKQAPVFISFGVGDAKEDSIARVGIDRAMMADKVESVPAALTSVLRSLTNSILSSSRNTDPQIVLPDPDATMRILPSREAR